MIIVKLGDAGPDVRRLQHLLNTMLVPCPNLSTDGAFGNATDAAVRLLQRQKGFTVNGIVEAQTWAALNQIVRAGTTQEFAVVNPARPKWMDIAIVELGVAELTGVGRHNQRILQYHQTTSLRATEDEVPWCSSFVNWVLRQAGIRGTNSAAAKSWLTWGTPIDAPRNGAIAVIKSVNRSGNVATGSSSGYHVAFFDSITATHIRLLGGNQSDRVKYSSFNLAAYSVEGYRWP